MLSIVQMAILAVPTCQHLGFMNVYIETDNEMAI